MNLTKQVKVEGDALEVIAQMQWEAGKDGQVIGKIVEQLNRKLYEMVNKGLEALGGKWNSKLKGHLFSSDPRPEIEGLLQSGVVVVQKDGFFPTPVPVIKRMVETLGDPAALMKLPILEPSAGEGAICEYLRAIGCTDIQAIEKNEKRREILRSKGFSVLDETDFLRFQGSYPAIVMNPPFELMQDVDHITYAFSRCLLPGGQLISVCSEGPFFRTGSKSEMFRKMVSTYGFSTKLADGSFRSSGTGVNTRLVYLEMPDSVTR